MRRIVFVVGMHRSGTSALSGALKFAGFEHGPALMPPQADNPDGFFEPLPVVRLNTRLLAMAGARWDRIPLTLDFETLAPRPFGEWCATLAGPAAAEAWDGAYEGTSGDLVCKDPRLALTLPLWLRTAKEKGFAAEVILVHRNPLAVIASLNRRNGIGFAGAAELVTDYWLEMIANAPKGATRVVSFEAFLGEPKGTLDRLGYGGAEQAAYELKDFLRTPQPPPPVPAAAIPEPLRLLDTLLRDAHGTLLAADEAVLNRLLRDRENRKRYAGSTTLLGEPPAPAVVRAHRTVVLHCHVFKNAGSSVDVLLRSHFGKGWVSHEFPVRPSLSNADLTNAFIRQNDAIAALSTHTGDWWLGHDGGGLKVLPIIFLRHPLLRIRSAYSFERKQQADTLGAKLAKELDFPGYVRARLDRPSDLAFRDFQARRLAAFDSRVVVDLRTTALRTLDRLPFVGLVEDFDASVRRLQDFLAPHVPGFKAYGARVNVTENNPAPPEDRLATVREELGEDLYDALTTANLVDFEVYELASGRHKEAGGCSDEPLQAPEVPSTAL